MRPRVAASGVPDVHQQEQVDTHMGSARGGYSPTPPLTLEAEEAVDSSEGGASTPSTPGTAGSAAAAAAAAAVLQHSDPFGEDDEPPAVNIFVAAGAGSRSTVGSIDNTNAVALIS